MKKSLLLTLMILGTPAFADGNAVDRAQPQPPSKVKVTTTVTTERTVGGQTTTETAQPVTQEMAWKNSGKQSQRLDNAMPAAAAPAPAAAMAQSAAASPEQQLRDSFIAMQQANSPEEMAAPLQTFTAIAEHVQGADADIAPFRQGVEALRSAVGAGDLAGAKAQLDAIAQTAVGSQLLR